MLSLQQISLEDRSTLYEMVQRYWLEIMPHSPVVQNPALRLPYFEAQFQFEKPDSFQWWAQVNDQHIGFTNVLLFDDGLGQVCGGINDFYIEPTWRRQHYGRAFVEALRNWMKQEGISRIDLHVRSDAPTALAFWKSVGFQLASYRMREYLF